MKTWNEKAAEFDLAGKPLTKALLEKAAADLGAMGEACVLALGPCEGLNEMVARAVSADISALLIPSLMDRLNASGEDLPFPRDRVLTFVCGIWFLTAAVPRLKDEGTLMDMHDLAREMGRFFFMPYDEENGRALSRSVSSIGRNCGLSRRPRSSSGTSILSDGLHPLRADDEPNNRSR